MVIPHDIDVVSMNSDVTRFDFIQEDHFHHGLQLLGLVDQSLRASEKYIIVSEWTMESHVGQFVIFKTSLIEAILQVGCYDVLVTSHVVDSVFHSCCGGWLLVDEVVELAEAEDKSVNLYLF